MTSQDSQCDQQSTRFRFSVRRLFVITTIVAVVVGFAWSLELPEFMQALIAILGLVYAFIFSRVPAISADYKRFKARQRRVAVRRAELERQFGPRGFRESNDSKPAASEPQPTATPSGGERRR